MLAQDFLFDSIEGGARRIDLCQNVDAITILLEHVAHLAHLPLDSGEAPETAIYYFCIDA